MKTTTQTEGPRITPRASVHGGPTADGIYQHLAVSVPVSRDCAKNHTPRNSRCHYALTCYSGYLLAPEACQTCQPDYDYDLNAQSYDELREGVRGLRC